MNHFSVAVFAVFTLGACKGGGGGSSTSVAPPPSNVPAKLENASLTSESMTVNGLKAEAFQCAGGGGFTAFFGEMGGLVTQRAAIRACSKDAIKPRVHWTIKKGVVSDVRVAGISDAKTARCVADAIGKITLADFDATCIATLPLDAVAK